MLATLISIAGAILLARRYYQYQQNQREDLSSFDATSALPCKVSVIIPARNEEANLPRLLASLTQHSDANLEIIVVDDRSTDQTYDIACAYKANVLRGSERPQGWGGKQWACHQGAQFATGDILLFTDADTWHDLPGLHRAVQIFQSENLDMMSVLPYHAASAIWEKLTGFFQLFLLVAANAFGRPSAKRPYCIGQYIMFSRHSYQTLGGHEVVKHRLVEDVPLAKLAIAKGLRYRTLTNLVAYSVRMYDTPKQFINGWRRNFAAGLKDSSLIATGEIGLVLGTFLLGGTIFPSFIQWLSFALSTIIGAIIIRRYSNYGWLSIVGLPISIFLFCLITALAIFDSAIGRQVNWKGRMIRADA